MICLKPLQILHHIFCHQTNSSRRCPWITCMASQISSTTFLNGTIQHTTCAGSSADSSTRSTSKEILTMLSRIYIYHEGEPHAGD